MDSVRRRFGDRQEAHEVVHDVCVNLLASPEKETVRVPLALLHKIIHDRAISHYRSERRRQAWVDDYAELDEVLCSAPGPERQHAAMDELEHLCAAIAELPPRCQQVFVMHKIHQLPQHQVAKQLGISLKAVEKHLRVGMRKCLARLSQQPVRA
nr:RNA polymerase sigma factor [Halopseudomonas maritima]